MHTALLIRQVLIYNTLLWIARHMYLKTHIIYNSKYIIILGLKFNYVFSCSVVCSATLFLGEQ